MSETNGTQNTLQQNTVLFLFETHAIGESSSVKETGQFVTPHNIDARRIAMSKRLFDCPELHAIRGHYTQFQRYLKSISAPTKQLKSGLYLIRQSAIQTLRAVKIPEFCDALAPLVEAFLAVYPAELRNAEHALAGLYNPADYVQPTQEGWQEAVRQHFGVKYQFLSFDVPDSIRQIDPAIFEQERARVAQQWEDMAQHVQLLLRAQAQATFQQLATRLQPQATNGRVVFSETTLTRIRTFLQDFMTAGGNVTNDTELATLMQAAQELLDGVDARSLRQNTDLREAVRESCQAIDAEMSRLLDQGKRGRVVKFTLATSTVPTAVAG